MKKGKYILTIMALLINMSIFGQYSLGIKTGISISDAQTNLYVDAINDAPKSHTSFLVGARADILLNQNFYFQPELQYVRRGFTINEGTSFKIVGIDVPVGAKATTQINYIEAPLLAKAKINIANISFYGILGPSIGYATSASIQPKVTLILDFNLPSIDLDLSEDLYNRTDYAGIIGGGVEQNIQSGKLFADVRYTHSFTNIIDDPIVDVSVRNTALQLSVGYAYIF